MEQNSNKRLAKNTLLLYLRMIIVILVNLYASRVILANLGIDDYGIFNVVAGIVSMFVFLNTAMVASSQRFIAFEQGRDDADRQKTVYSTSVLIHLAIALVVLLLAETAGLWFLNNKMNIAPERMQAANWVYQSSIACFLLKICIVPDTASVVAHERMSLYAIASIVFAGLQLAAAMCLKQFGGDKLILYAVLLIAVEAVNFLIYKVYTRVSFKECRFRKPKDRALFMEMLSFAGWSFVGNFGIAMRGPGVNIVINQFAGPAVNAARGLAYQVSSVVSNFVNNFQMALTPQITKDYASDDRIRMMTLVKSGSRISFYLLAFIVVPLFIRASSVLGFWLEEVPEMTVEFLRLVLIVGLVNSMVGPITTALQATGNIKVFQITIAILMLLELPLAYALLSFGIKPYMVVYISVFIELAALVARILLLNAQIPLKLTEFFFGIIGKCALVFLAMFSLPFFIDKLIPDTFPGLVLLTLISVLWSALVVFVLGLSAEERTFLMKQIKKKI
ncbi:MAG: lipopolysaccharide biosynthesis protein [Bacteroidales bacterium]|nr:lipopolysaccharide biosynthesis protein [Bacteroidales bacterium]